MKIEFTKNEINDLKNDVVMWLTIIKNQLEKVVNGINQILNSINKNLSDVINNITNIEEFKLYIRFKLQTVKY